MKTIGFIGGGRITKIFLQAFENVNITFEKVSVFDTNSEVLSKLKLKYPSIHVTTDDLKDVAKSDIIMIALHPPVIMETLTRIKDFLSPNSIIVSLAPKLTIAQMTAQLDGFANIARMNPSASTIVNRGVNPICFSPGMSNENKVKLSNLMSHLGNTPEVKESKIEAYAVITAMGHTYFFFQIQKLRELALSFGLGEEETQSAITEMLYASGLTFFYSGLSYEEVADLVPVKPLGEVEETIMGYYDQYLNAIYNKIKPVAETV
jgi:pyrroline-5-carboxylate reductase